MMCKCIECIELTCKVSGEYYANEGHQYLLSDPNLICDMMLVVVVICLLGHKSIRLRNHTVWYMEKSST